MKQMNSITKEVERDLKMIAGRLPELPLATSVKKDGAEILKENPNINDGRKNPILPNVTYQVRSGGVLQRVNHFKRLKSAYRQKGWPGVSEYVDPYCEKPKTETIS